MSYCRWSTNDFQCDVYCYEDVGGGYTTHVAYNRVVYTEPLPPHVPFDEAHLSEWFDRHKQVLAMVGDADRVRIGLAHDGEDFNDPTLGDLLERLVYLKSLGYVVPDSALRGIRCEIEEGEE